MAQLGNPDIFLGCFGFCWCDVVKCYVNRSQEIHSIHFSTIELITQFWWSERQLLKEDQETSRNWSRGLQMTQKKLANIPSWPQELTLSFISSLKAIGLLPSELSGLHLTTTPGPQLVLWTLGHQQLSAISFESGRVLSTFQVATWYDVCWVWHFDGSKPTCAQKFYSRHLKILKNKVIIMT